MSEENVDAVHRVFDAYNRRDLEAFLAMMEPEVEFTPYERAVEGLGPYTGHEGVRTWWNETFGVLPDLTAEIHEVRSLGDKTLVHGRLWGQGAASGAPIERTIWLVIRWRNGKELWWHAFQSETDALQAAGLTD